MTKRAVVVTTEHRGVFFGFLDGQSDTEKVLSLAEARMCVFWSEDVRGVVGLAANGPTSGCRVTAAVPKLTVQAVTAVMDATDEAVMAWRMQPWG